MAIGFRAVGARTKADVSFDGSPLSVALPLGHVSGDLLVLVILNDDNTGPTSTPSGWSQLIETSPGLSSATPYVARPRTSVFYRIDNGVLGSSVSVSFSTASYPTGDPFVLAFVAAYTGCDTSSPIGEWGSSNTTASTVALAHPQITTTLANDWLLTLRAASSDSPPPSFTDSVGTDVERVDDNMGSETAFALYDSNTALSAGLQTQRTTTASRACTYGSVMMTIAIRPSAVAGSTTAVAGTASVSMLARDIASTATSGPWDLCAPGGLPTYSYAIDWNSDGNFTASSAMLMLPFMGTGGVDDTTQDVVSDVTFSYGRDQDRQLNPGSVGSAAMTVCNVSRKYSPDNSSSPLFGDLDPAREARFQVDWSGAVFPLFRGRVDDFEVHADFGDRTVGFTFLDGMALLQGVKLSTGVYESLRTGQIIGVILDQMGWTAGRDIDVGATIVKFWWAEGTDAMTAVNDIVKSEGPPAVAYVAPDGTFVFRDRHHRLQNSTSVNVQGSFASKALGTCTATDQPGLNISRPFTYAHGWRDIINSIAFDVSERVASAYVTNVWTSEDTITLATGQGISIDISGSDPFRDAVTPVAGTDFTAVGIGTVNVTLNRTSGQSVQITLLAVGGSVVISGLKLRARTLPVLRTVKVQRRDTGSISQHGERAYPDSAPWANVNDAGAIADMVLLHYARRRPTVQLRVVVSDPVHFFQVMQRTISDRVHIRNDEMSVDQDFFVERVTHTIQRANAPGRPPVHGVVLGCERVLDTTSNPFTFDKRGAGFDAGVFDPISSDDADTVFIFDDPIQGMFDTGLFGT